LIIAPSLAAEPSGAAFTRPAIGLGRTPNHRKGADGTVGAPLCLIGSGTTAAG